MLNYEGTVHTGKHGHIHTSIHEHTPTYTHGIPGLKQQDKESIVEGKGLCYIQLAMLPLLIYCSTTYRRKYKPSIKLIV